MTEDDGRFDVTQAVWHGLIGCEYHQRYLRRVAERSRLAHQVLMVVIALGSAIVASDLVVNYASNSIVLAASAVIAVATIAELTFRPAVTAAEAAAASRQYGLMAHDWDDLWWNQSSPDARESIRLLTKQMFAVHFPESFWATWTLRKSYQEALASVSAAYASS